MFKPACSNSTSSGCSAHKPPRPRERAPRSRSALGAEDAPALHAESSLPLCLAARLAFRNRSNGGSRNARYSGLSRGLFPRPENGRFWMALEPAREHRPDSSGNSESLTRFGVEARPAGDPGLLRRVG